MVANARRGNMVSVRLAYTLHYELCGVRFLLDDATPSIKKKSFDSSEVFVGEIGKCIWADAEMPLSLAKEMKSSLLKFHNKHRPVDKGNLLKKQIAAHKYLDPQFASQFIQVKQFAFGACYHRQYFLEDVFFSLTAGLNHTNQKIKNERDIEIFEITMRDVIRATNDNEELTNQILNETIEHFCTLHNYSFSALTDFFDKNSNSSNEEC